MPYNNVRYCTITRICKILIFGNYLRADDISNQRYKAQLLNCSKTALKINELKNEA